jgi:hypothetical protein
MYRERTLLKVTPEGWNPTIQPFNRLSEIARERGWQEATIWTQTFGPFGELMIEIDYPDLTTYQKQTSEFFADRECMNLTMETMKYRAGDGHNEMWQRADEVATG